jgi:hypothetical protein
MKNYLFFCFLFMAASVVSAEPGGESRQGAVKLKDLEMDRVTAGEVAGLSVSSQASASGSSSSSSSVVSYEGQIVGYGSATTTACCDGDSDIKIEFVPIFVQGVQTTEALISKVDFLKLKPHFKLLPNSGLYSGLLRPRATLVSPKF